MSDLIGKHILLLLHYYNFYAIKPSYSQAHFFSAMAMDLRNGIRFPRLDQYVIYHSEIRMVRYICSYVVPDHQGVYEVSPCIFTPDCCLCYIVPLLVSESGKMNNYQLNNYCK
jgi:hypothetical protein